MSEWVRHGECDQCGWCCRTLATAALRFPNATEAAYREVRGIKEHPEGGGFKVLHIIDPCPKLSEQNLCTIYEERPDTCRAWPSSPLDVRDAPCTFWFEHPDGRQLGGTRSPFPHTSGLM